MPAQPTGHSDELTRTRDSGMDMLPPGTMLAGRYRIVEIAGVGGMGVVYRAVDEQLDTEVAIKLLRTDRQVDAESLERFRREVLLARKVSHPNVVRLHDLGQDGEVLFITMDYVQGQTLREKLADGPMPLEAVLNMASDLAAALAVAHRQGVIHRDLKPGNVLIDQAGRALIMDFGVARSLADSQMTRVGQLVGTPAYLSPEQVRGESVDARTDLFALGLVLCEALSGRQIDAGTTLDELLGRRAGGHTPDPARLISGLPAWTSRMLRRLIAARPADRYPDAESLLADLNKGRARRHFRRGRISALATVSIIVLAGLALWWMRPAPETTQDVLLGPIAVLPLANATGQAHLDWAGRSLSENLTAGLAELPGLQLIDSLRVLRMLEDLGIDPANIDDRNQLRLLELLELQSLIAGRIVALDDGFRIELRVIESAGTEPFGLSAEVSSRSPLAALPALIESLTTALARTTPTLPMAPISENPEALAQYDIGLSMISQDRALEAVEALRRSVEHDPGFAAAWSRLAQALDASGQYQAAVDSAQTAVDLLSGHGGRVALEAKARLAALSGDMEGATAQLNSLLMQYPADAQARLEMSELLMSQGQFDQARIELERLTAIDPQHSRAWLLLGQILILSGDPQQAIEEQLTRALLIENRLGNDQRRGDIFNAMGIAHQRLGELDSARTNFEQAVQLRSLAGDRRGVAGTRANLAHLALIQGDFDDAREQLSAALTEREALGDQAGMADLFNELGVLEEESGDYQAALVHYREALRLRELLGQIRALGETYNNIAFVNFMLGDLAGARQFNRSALDQLSDRSNPAGRIMALETSGYLGVAAGDWDGATRAFLEALDLSRDIGQPWSEAVAHGGLGLVASQQGRFEAAFSAYQRARLIAIDLDDVRSLAAYELRIAELEILGGQLADASQRLDSLESHIGQRQYVGHLADWHRLQGLLAIARGQLDQAQDKLGLSMAFAERSGNQVQRMQAELLSASLAQSGVSEELMLRAERLGHRPLTLEAIVLTARSALDRNDAELAASLARRGLRPPLSIRPWANNWQLHWLISHAEGSDPTALGRAESELIELLLTMPVAWRDDYVRRLPKELMHVEIPTASVTD